MHSIERRIFNLKCMKYVRDAKNFSPLFLLISLKFKKKLNLEIEIEIPLVILLTFALFLGRTCHYRKSRLIISHISPFEKESERVPIPIFIVTESENVIIMFVVLQ